MSPATSLGSFSRLRSNPFFEVIRTKIVETLTRDEREASGGVAG